MQLTATDWVVVLAYGLIALMVGLYFVRRAGRGTDEFFLAGRKLPWWLLGTSMVATTFSTDTPNLVTDLVRNGGVSQNWVWWAFLITGMCTVFFYAKLWRRSGVFTDIGFYELRYSGKPAAFLRGFRALYLGIRRDEHGIRAKERVFSPRDEDFEWDYKNQPPELWDQYKSKAKEEEHLRVHPLLGWTELDIWRYIKREEIPVVSLYFAKDGKRFRSIGCEPCVNPVDSNADTLDKIIQELKETDVSERSGRAQDKESDYMMQKLRALGYM